MATREIPWEKIKADYLSGISITDIAKKYGFNYNTLKNKIYNYGWKNQKAKVTEKIVEKSIESLSKNIAKKQFEVKTRYAKYFSDLSKKINKSLKKTESISGLMQISRTLDYCRRNEFACYGIPDKVEVSGKDGESLIPSKIEVKFI